MTIADALSLVQSRSISFRDAEVLLSEVLGCDRTYLHAHPERILSAEEATSYEAFLQRRESNEPVAYIIGHKEFYGRQFHCDARGLIPRPETEGLVEQAIRHAEAFFAQHTEFPCPISILELGTGCGCIAISIALELAAKAIPATILATDISADALALAQKNWETLSAGYPLGNIQLTFIQADLFDAPQIAARPFDTVLANLPYVEDTWKTNPLAQPEVVFQEPDVALFGGGDGLDIYRRFFTEVPAHLKQEGSILIEYGETQTALMRPLIEQALPRKKLTVYQDYAGLDRVIELI